MTHSPAVLPLADMIVVMEDGKIIEMGSYQKLLSDRQKFAEFLQVYCQETKGSRSSAEGMFFMTCTGFVLNLGYVVHIKDFTA